MKPFGKKHFLHNILHSKVSVIVIIVFAIYLSISVFERFSVERDMAERRFVSEKELAELRARKEILEKKGGFLYSHWCGNGECELKIKEETKATIRCIPENSPEEKGQCIYCGKPSERRVIFARNY